MYYLINSSNKGHMIAQLFLGHVYYEGKYIQQDINKAIHYFTLSAYQNNSIAQLRLGTIYYEGKYIKRDTKKAIQFLTNSAFQNNSNAQYYLGMIYYDGKYIPQNINKSIQFLTISSNQCNSEAQFLLGMIYYDGKYIVRDIQKAIHYFKECSSYNNNYAKNNLGIIYKNGDGVKKNIYFAIVYFKEAIQQNNDIFSLYNLSRIFYFGIDIEPNIQESIKMLEQLEEIGFKFANILLYSIYSFGYKFIIDKKKADYYIIKMKSYKNAIDTFHQRVFSFFKDIDFVYWKNVNYFNDFLLFLFTGKLNSDNSKTDKETIRENINNDFYEGFYND